MRLIDDPRDEICTNLGLHNGQFFGYSWCTNLTWFLNGEEFGYGDLRPDDIASIMTKMDEEDVFEAAVVGPGVGSRTDSVDRMLVITKYLVNDFRGTKCYEASQVPSLFRNRM